MRANPVPFTGDVAIETGDSDVVGISFSGFTSVAVYNGSDATGDLALYCPGPGMYGLNYELEFSKGVFLDTSGVGKGCVWIA